MRENQLPGAAAVDFYPSPMNSPNGRYPGQRVLGLTRFGSAPGSLLANLVDSYSGGAAAALSTGGAAESSFSLNPPQTGTFISHDSTSNKRKFGQDLTRHRSSPPDFLSHLLLDNGPSFSPTLSLSLSLDFYHFRVIR